MTFIAEYDADVMLLSETHLGPQLEFSLPGYTCYHQDRPLNQHCVPSGGMAVHNHMHTSHRLLATPDMLLIKACVVTLEVNSLEVRLISAYAQPVHSAPLFLTTNILLL